MCRASARSIPEFNIIEALRESQGLFIKSGGHAQAAGFTMPVSSLSDLKSSLAYIADEALRGAELTPFLEYECEVSPAIFAGDTFGFVQSLSPFGEGNRSPTFLTRNARVVEARQVGSGGHHLKMRVWHEGTVWDAIAFRQGDKIGVTQNRIDLVYTVGLDTWGYKPKVQLIVQDFRQSPAVAQVARWHR